MYVSAVAEVSSHWRHKRFAVGGPLSRFHDWLIPFVFGTGHALVHCLSDNRLMFDDHRPRWDLVNPCAYRLFSKEESSELHLLKRNLSAKIDVRQIFLEVPVPCVVIHHGVVI